MRARVASTKSPPLSWVMRIRAGHAIRGRSALTSIPGIAGPVGDRRAARILGTLGLLVENGVALPTALKILRDVVSEPRTVAALDRLHDQVRNGRRFADALAETDVLPVLAVRMLRGGDETGDLLLQGLAHRKPSSWRLKGDLSPSSTSLSAPMGGRPRSRTHDAAHARE